MRSTLTRPRLALLTVAALVPLLLSACSDSGSDSGDTAKPATPAGGSGTVCTGVGDTKLVALEDDKQLQLSDNIVPVVRTAVDTPALDTALNKVSAALSQDKLLALNVATDVDREQPADAAAAFVKANGLDTGLSGGSGTVKVVAANFSESQTLANVYAQTLKAAGFQSSVVPLGNRELYTKALAHNEVDVVPEYAATLTEFFNAAKNGASATPLASEKIEATIAALTPLAAANGLNVLEPADATDQNAFAVTKAFADKYDVSSLSELAAACGGGLTMGGPTECPTRKYCQQGLESTYALKITGFTTLDAGGPLTKNAIKSGQVTFGLVFSSDAALGSS